MSKKDEVEEVEVQEEESEFSNVFAQIAAERDGTEEDEPESDDQEEEEESPDDSDEEESASEDTGEPQSGDHLWEDLSEAQQRALQELQRERDEYRHWKSSNEGRISALQRKINELSAQPNRQQPPSAEVIRKAQASSAAWEQFKDDYPEIAEVMEERLSAQQSQIEQQVRWLREAEEQRVIQQQYAALEAAHPDWRSIAVSDDFKSWLYHQPVRLQEIASSNDAQEVSALLEFYKASHRPAPTNSEDDSPRVSKIQEKRQRRLRESVSPRTTSGGGSTTIPKDDFSAAFNAFSNRMEGNRR